MPSEFVGKAEVGGNRRRTGGMRVTVLQSGGIMILDGQLVLRRTRKGEYLFPKGHVDPGETLEQTAIREVAEEVGVEAEISGELGEISFTFQGEDIRATFFMMKGIRRLPGWEEHLRTDTVVVAPDEAERLLSFENYRNVWRKARERLLASRD